MLVKRAIVCSLCKVMYEIFNFYVEYKLPLPKLCHDMIKLNMCQEGHNKKIPAKIREYQKGQ